MTSPPSEAAGLRRGVTRVNGLGRADVARCWAGFASLGAGLVHLAVLQEHYEQWWLFGAFFAVVGTAQVLWAVAALARDDAPLPRTVSYANLVVVGLWLITRTTGLPIGPEPWRAEALGRADVLAVALELAVVALVVAAGRLRRPALARTAGSTGRFVALMFAGALAVSAVTTPALAATPAGGQAHHHFADHH